MTEKSAIDKNFLHKLLRELESKAHHTYAVMYGLPKEHIYLYRFYDCANNIEGCEDPEQNTFSIPEFYDRIDTFHPDDDFGVYFAVHLDRIDSVCAGEYTDHICIDTRKEATVGNVREYLSIFLESYCEKCLRDNSPFELSPEIVARFGLTPEDIRILGRLLDSYNAAARKMIRAEYDALKELDFIRDGKATA